MKTIAMTGGNGLIGSRVVELLSPSFSFIQLSHIDMDITDKASVLKAIEPLEFDYFLHLAAYTQVDKAEEEAEIAHKINVEGTAHVFEAVEKKSKPFIELSTDFVFDGTNPPYKEDSAINPISMYGKTKADAEAVITGKAAIVRVAYPYRAEFDKKPDFVRAIKKRLEDNLEVKAITDSTFTPTFIDDIANALKVVIENYAPGIYHAVGAQSLSPYDASILIAETFGLHKELVTATTYELFFANRAQRPKNCDVLPSSPFAMHTFKEGLEIMKNQLKTA